MIYHILNGDSIGYRFPQAKIPGEAIIFREALMSGPLNGETQEEFWSTRAKQHKRGSNEYQSMVIDELNQIAASKAGYEFNLWFEYDVFCQANSWFVYSLLSQLSHTIKVFTVLTTHLEQGHKYFWNGFGPATPEQLRACFNNRIQLTKKDLALGNQLWQAFRNRDNNTLQQLSKQQSPAFPYLKDIVEAHLDTERPARVINEIVDTGTMGFENTFSAFWKQESIYGFGDVQLKVIYASVMHERKQRKNY